MWVGQQRVGQSVISVQPTFSQYTCTQAPTPYTLRYRMHTLRLHTFKCFQTSNSNSAWELKLAIAPLASTCRFTFILPVYPVLCPALYHTLCPTLSFLILLFLVLLLILLSLSLLLLSSDSQPVLSSLFSTLSLYLSSFLLLIFTPFVSLSLLPLCVFSFCCLVLAQVAISTLSITGFCELSSRRCCCFCELLLHSCLCCFQALFWMNALSI